MKRTVGWSHLYLYGRLPMNGRGGAMLIIAVVLTGMRLAISPGRSSSPERSEAKISSVQESSPDQASCDVFDESSAKNDSNSANKINGLVERYLYRGPQKTSLEPH